MRGVGSWSRSGFLASAVRVPWCAQGDSPVGERLVVPGPGGMVSVGPVPQGKARVPRQEGRPRVL